MFEFICEIPFDFPKMKKFLKVLKCLNFVLLRYLAVIKRKFEIKFTIKKWFGESTFHQSLNYQVRCLMLSLCRLKQIKKKNRF